jgi:hypothetical protein
MRRAAFAVTLAVASGALAAPAAQAPLTWADWVGDWSGKVTWKGCAIDEDKKVSLPLDATDGSIAMDLTSAGGSLGAMGLTEDGTGFAAKQGDIALKLARTDKGLELAVDLDSGCQLRGTLTRTSVGIPACDQLAAWSRIEHSCTKLTRPPLENPSRLARQRAEWSKAKGDARDKLAAKCTTRAARVQAELVDIGCAPNPDPSVGMRGAECQALRGVSARVQRCSNVPFDVRTNLEREVVVLLAAMQGADQASIPVVDAECKSAREKLFAIAQQAGCPP